MKRAQWSHKKYRNQKFHSRHKRLRYGDRIFELENVKTGRIISFESWQQAKKLGWVRNA